MNEKLVEYIYYIDL